MYMYAAEMSAYLALYLSMGIAQKLNIGEYLNLSKHFFFILLDLQKSSRETDFKLYPNFLTTMIIQHKRHVEMRITTHRTSFDQFLAF